MIFVSLPCRLTITIYWELNIEKMDGRLNSTFSRKTIVVEKKAWESLLPDSWTATVEQTRQRTNQRDRWHYVTPWSDKLNLFVFMCELNSRVSESCIIRETSAADISLNRFHTIQTKFYSGAPMVIHKFNDKILTSTSRRSEAVIAKISAKNDSHRRKEQIYKQKSSIFFFRR